MKKRSFILATIASLLLNTMNSIAAPIVEPLKETASNDFPEIRKALTQLVPGIAVDSIKQSAIPSLYEVAIGADVIYVTSDGRFMLQGNLIDLVSKANLTEDKRAQGRLKIINNIDTKTMIVYSPKQVKHIVTVFTDIDCPYCRKMHEEMADYNKLGIEIRYLAFPRAGINSPSYDKTVAVWCAKDRNAALTASKAGKPVEQKTCKNPVQDHLSLVETLGLSGTPTLIFEDGTMIPGYVPADRLIKVLEEKSIKKPS